MMSKRKTPQLIDFLRSAPKKGMDFGGDVWR